MKIVLVNLENEGFWIGPNSARAHYDYTNATNWSVSPFDATEFDNVNKARNVARILDERGIEETRIWVMHEEASFDAIDIAPDEGE